MFFSVVIFRPILDRLVTFSTGVIVGSTVGIVVGAIVGEYL